MSNCRQLRDLDMRPFNALIASNTVRRIGSEGLLQRVKVNYNQIPKRLPATLSEKYVQLKVLRV
jgi:hypothetical protein